MVTTRYVEKGSGAMSIALEVGYTFPHLLNVIHFPEVSGNVCIQDVALYEIQHFLIFLYTVVEK